MLKDDAIRNLDINDELLHAAELVEVALSTSEPLHFQQQKVSVRSLWDNLRKEVYDLLCTRSAKYKTERDLFGVSAKPAIAALATYLTGSFGVSIAAATALASLALLLPFKMLTKSWCETAQSAMIQEEELTALKHLRQTHTPPEGQ